MCDLAFALLEIRLSQEVAVRKHVAFALVVYLHIRAKIMLIKFVGAHPCIQSGKLNLPGEDSVATLRPWKKSAADFSVHFRPDRSCLCVLHLTNR
jgi:hypothetical protein